jgi:hypothetical protein
MPRGSTIDMAQKYVMINDIIEEHNARMQNLRKYYPFFVLAETTFAQYKEGKYSQLDMGYITMAVLRFFIEENNFNEREVGYAQYDIFMKQLLARDFDVEIALEDMDDLVLYIFDKIRNDGRAFEFSFYDPGKKQKNVGRVKLLDSRIMEGRVCYYITADGIEFYLDTKEVRDESKINVEQLLLEKMITGENFKGGIDVVKRINNEVNKLVREKDHIVDMLSYDVFAGAEAYENYMKTVGKWFSEEQKLFAKNKALVDKAITKASFDNITGNNSKTMEEISQLELELKKTILKHGNLINSTMELQNVSDNIIQKAKLKKLRPVFDFGQELHKIIENDRPDKLLTILGPLFAPRINKSFSMTSIDNMLTLKAEDDAATTKVKKENVNAGFRYEDELLEEKIGENFGKLFFELMDQITKWQEINLKEFNGILEIKFGKEIYENKDYYSFLTHLAQKQEYDINQMLKKQDTMLEGIVVSAINKYKSGLKDAYAPDISFDRFKNLRFSLTFDYEEEIHVGEDMYVTNIIFKKIK